MSAGSLQRKPFKKNWQAELEDHNTYDWFVPGVQSGPLGERRRYMAYEPLSGIF
jgi:hypothetical protein